MLLDRLFTRPQPDGTAPALEALATGRVLSPAAAIAPAVTVTLPEGGVPTGQSVVLDTVMAKVLHGWLENRHQTLFPLTVNIRALTPVQRETLARMAATALLAGDAATAREDRVRRWLAESGGAGDLTAALDTALASPPALSTVLQDVLRDGLGAYAYVAAVVALDMRDAGNAAMLAYLAVRLGLPATLVRSAMRRYK